MNDVDWAAIVLVLVFCMGVVLQSLLLKGWPRYGLRTLLIAITVIAVGLGVVRWLVN
jgi:hypothetical protein